MSLMALGAFAQGLGGAMQDRKDRKEREASNARMDRYISAIENMPRGLGVAGYELSGASTGQAGYGAPSGGSVAGDGTLFGLIDATEGAGNYDTLYGHSQNGGAFNGVKVSSMTLDQLGQFARPDGEYGQWVKGRVGRVATPMGRHQIVGSTLRTAAAEMGLSPDTKFTPGIQDAIADHLASRRLAGAETAAGKRAALRAEWAGFKNVSDSALDAAIAQFEANGMMSKPRQMGAGPV